MSVEVVPGGQRRIDRVLGPGFTEGGRGGRRLLPAPAAPGPARHPPGRAGAPLGRGRPGCGRAAGRPAEDPRRRRARHLQRRPAGPGDDPAIRRVVAALPDLDEYGPLGAADGQAARDAGADAYLVKPFSSLALLDAVKRLTDG